jgi:hypothetical protein
MLGNFTVAMSALWCAIFFIFLQTGPLQAALVARTDIKIRSMAFALNIFIIHALGDARSPRSAAGSVIYSSGGRIHAHCKPLL